MTEAEILALVECSVRKWQARLFLGDWIILSEVGPLKDDDWGAQVAITWRERAALVTVRPDVAEKTRDAQPYIKGATDAEIIDRTVLHELLHIVEEPLAARIDSEIKWAAGENGVLGAELRNSWSEYREWWVNHQVRVLIEADRSCGWSDPPTPPHHASAEGLAMIAKMGHPPE